jgi:hypothetical protein
MASAGLDGEHLTAHRRDRAGDLLDGLAATRSAIKGPPICDGVTSPDIMLSTLRTRFASMPQSPPVDERLDLDHGLNASGSARRRPVRHSNPRRGQFFRIR